MKSEAKIFKALADENRLRILALLLEGELCVCELMAALELPQSTVSRHLSYLKNSGWLEDRREGIWMYYRLNENAGTLIESLLPVLSSQLGDTNQVKKDRGSLETFRSNQSSKACNEQSLKGHQYS